MSKNPYHFWFHEDALFGMSKLSLELRGAYITLLDLMYTEEGYLEDDEYILANSMRVSTRKYRSVRDALIKAGKIYYPIPGFLSNHRVEKEVVKRIQRSTQAKLSGKLGGKSRHENWKLRNEINKTLKPNSSSLITQRENPSEISPSIDGDCGTSKSQKSIIDFQERLAKKGFRNV